MAGSAGIGKSSLAERIGTTLWRRHILVDAFGEEEIFTRPQFVHVAEGFRNNHHPSPFEFEVAYGAWLGTLMVGTVAVIDWNPAGMAGDLPWASSDRACLQRHLEAVRMLARGKVLLLHLQAPAEVCIERGGQQRGEDWLARSDQIARSSGHHHAERIDRLVAETARHAARTQDELRVAADAGWLIHTIDAAEDAQKVHDHVVGVVESILDRTG